MICFGEDEKLVIAVLAVRGRSPDTFDNAEEEGNLPVSSRLRIRAFKSSNSSHTVEGAVVDRVDSVPSWRTRSVSNLGRSTASEKEPWREVREPERVEGRYVRVSEFGSRVSAGTLCESGDASRLEAPSRLRPRPEIDRGVAALSG